MTTVISKGSVEYKEAELEYKEAELNPKLLALF